MTYTSRMLTLLLLCTITSLGAFACGGSLDEEDKTAAAARTTTVVIASMKYSPTELTIARGGTITWSNTANQQHIVEITDGSGKEVARKVLNAGESYTHTFGAAGTYKFSDPGFASFAALKGTVTVK
ncbi:MAG: cupredoxin domain-containing protein [Myxococcota bacterium]